MSKSIVSIVKYEKGKNSVKKAIELANGFEKLDSNAKVFIKPNLVYWNRHCDFPKWGMLTTSTVMEEILILLKEQGVKDISIGEGIVTENPKDRETAEDAFEKLGYNIFKKRYGVKVYDIFQRQFEKVELAEGVTAKMNADMLHSDFLIDVPVLKTHAQCVVSLGIKNLKGTINIPSRKKFHGDDPKYNLHYNVSQLANKAPPGLTIIDGIYTLERGPTFDGKAHRSDIIVASTNILSADLVGSNLLGIDPIAVPHLVQAAKDRNRPIDLSDIEVKGERIDDLAVPHGWDFIYEKNNTLPLAYAKAGIGGISYPKYDETICTYCSFYNGVILTAIKSAWKGEDFDNVEILTGKIMEPSEGMNKTILLGQCQYNLNKDHPNINELIAIDGCPPQPENVQNALKQAGIKVPSYIFKNLEKAPLLFMQKYQGKPEFEEEFYQIN
ncbi:MAG: DUF362 domain-containing protein [Candidatus Lokiarchaeota archaeon]|nr:DUF362 domain-containing protein [Candidatus Lokiarchaeota archaeon]